MTKKHKQNQILNEESLFQKLQIVTKTQDREETGCKVLGCKGEPLITDDSTGEVICGCCGSILMERSVDLNSEQSRDFNEFLTKTRTGPEQSLSMFDMGMMTVMSDKDATGKSLSSSAKYTFGRLKKLNSRSRTPSNRTLRSALILLYSLKAKLGLPDSVTENAAYIYRKAMQKKITIGRSAKSLMGASVYTACRQAGVPRSLLDISNVTYISKKEIGRSYRNLVENLDLNMDHFEPVEYVSKIANEAKISEQPRREALSILQNLSEKGSVAGKNPMVLAASALYLGCVLKSERKTQSEIAKAAGVTSASIRIRYQELKNDLGLE
jgi:transcription initiation factor TFIIB